MARFLNDDETLMTKEQVQEIQKQAGVEPTYVFGDEDGEEDEELGGES